MEDDAQEYLSADGSAPFSESFLGLGDEKAKAKVDTVVRRLARGLRPDVKPVGAGVHESRLDYGPGYRIYFGNDGPRMIVLLLCGDKTTQRADITHAQALWADYKGRKHPSAKKQEKAPLLKLLRPFVKKQGATKDDTHS